jgi:hypothetical protein
MRQTFLIKIIHEEYFHVCDINFECGARSVRQMADIIDTKSFVLIFESQLNSDRIFELSTE